MQKLEGVQLGIEKIAMREYSLGHQLTIGNMWDLAYLSGLAQIVYQLYVRGNDFLLILNYYATCMQKFEERTSLDREDSSRLP